MTIDLNRWHSIWTILCIAIYTIGMCLIQCNTAAYVKALWSVAICVCPTGAGVDSRLICNQTDQPTSLSSVDHSKRGRTKFMDPVERIICSATSCRVKVYNTGGGTGVN